MPEMVPRTIKGKVYLKVCHEWVGETEEGERMIQFRGKGGLPAGSRKGGRGDR